MKNILKNWKTTLAGVISIVLLILVNTGTISNEDSSFIAKSVKILTENIEGIVAIVISIALIFSKDADSKD